MAWRQAEESARAGRLDEALAMLGRPDVADHRQAVALRGRLVLELVGRAARRAEADDGDGAIADLNLAERNGAPPDVLAAARLKLADRLAEEVRVHLDAGAPARVVEQVEALTKQHVGGPMLRRMREAADAWRKALDDARRGEFGLAAEGLERAERLAGGAAEAALAGARRDLEERRKSSHPRIEALYAALSAGRWGETLAAADAVLELVPEHPAAKQARSRGWQQIGGLNPAAAMPGRGGRVDIAFLNDEPAAPARPDDGINILEVRDRSPHAPLRRPDAVLRPSPRPAPAPQHARHDNPGPSGRFLLWADAIGGYLVCLDREVVLGRAGADAQADVQLLGDLSRRHATLVRDGDGYVIRAHHATFVNGKKVETAALRNGDIIRLGTNVELAFHQPSPVSATARLEFLSRHRLPVAVDGVVLMAETCIVGPSTQAHVPAPLLEAPVVLYRQGASLWCRAAGEFEVDGKSCLARAPLSLRSSVLGEGFSFSLEPLGPRPGEV